MLALSDCADKLFASSARMHARLVTWRGCLAASQATTYVIDAEFACVGPIAFDVGKMVGNFLLAFYASDGLASAAEPRHRQRRWLLQASRSTPSRFNTHRSSSCMMSSCVWCCHFLVRASLLIACEEPAMTLPGSSIAMC